jgi:hypothetical protein
VVVRTGGPHRSLAALEALIDDALAEAGGTRTTERAITPPDPSPGTPS